MEVENKVKEDFNENKVKEDFKKKTKENIVVDVPKETGTD